MYDLDTARIVRDERDDEQVTTYWLDTTTGRAWRVKLSRIGIGEYEKHREWKRITRDEYRAANAAYKASSYRSWVVTLEPELAAKVEALAKSGGCRPQDIVAAVVRLHFKDK